MRTSDKGNILSHGPAVGRSSQRSVERLQVGRGSRGEAQSHKKGLERQDGAIRPDHACGCNWKTTAGVQAGDSERVRTRVRAANGHIRGCEVDSIWRMIKQQRPKMTQ